MPNLKIDVAKFVSPFDSINAQTSLSLTEEQVLHAAITVGAPLLRKGTASARHALAIAAYKAVAIKATVDFSKRDLSGFKGYRQLDPSEKTNLSYWVGMVFTAILARELLGVEQLLHAACFNRRRVGMTKPSSKSLADLVGRDSSTEWHVFEAKGRQKKATTPDRNKWKEQSETINSIGGKKPKTRSFCIAMVGAIYRAELEDPDGKGSTIDIDFVNITRGISQPISEDNALLEAYYGPLRDVLEQSPIQISRGDSSFTLTRAAYDVVTNKYVFVGMEDAFFGSILRGEIPRKNEALIGNDFYLGSDGIVTLTSALCEPISN